MSAAERFNHDVAVRSIILMRQRADGSFSTDDILTSPRIRAHADPTALTGLVPGTMVIGDDGVIYEAGSDGVPEARAGSLADANPWTGTQTFQNIIFGAATELTIASGAVAATRSYHTIDTESDATTDDLDSITGGTAGEVLYLRLAAAARNVVVKHAIGTDKIATPGGRDLTIDAATDWVRLIHNGTQWTVDSVSTLTPAAGANPMWAGCPPLTDPSLCHVFFDDFTEARFAATQWVVTEDDAADTQTAPDVQHGVMTLTCKATTDNDANQVTWATESFKLTSGKRIWFEARVKSASADMVNSDWFVGICEAEDLTGVADNMPANGVGFHKEDGAATFSLSTSDNNVDIQSAAVGTIVNATYKKIGFLFNGGATGSGTITPYIDGVAGTAISTATYATMAELAAMFMVRNGDATTTQTLDCDYVLVVAEK